MSSDNNNNFILSNDQSNSPDNSVDIKSVKVESNQLVHSDTNTQVNTNTPISINDEEGLDKLSTLVNGGFGFSNYIVILTEDISSTSTPQQPFTPIGNNTHKFKGTFDGQGHTISNLHVIASYAGLFGYLDSNATVKNVGISADSSIGSSESRHAGGIAGLNDGTISNCYNTGTVTGSKDAGGIAGQNDGGTISNCYNTGAVTATSTNGSADSGGIAGFNDEGATIKNCYNTGTVTGSNVGGITGYNNETISNCYNTGTVTSSGDAGGIAGLNDGTISNCYNTGTVTGSKDAGGIAGFIKKGSIISNCYNTGTVTGSGDAGGIAGQNFGTISNCYNTGTVTGSKDAGGIAGQNIGSGMISNCYNTGEVNATPITEARPGGIAGFNDEGTISNCYNTGGISGTLNAGGIAGINNGTISDCYYLSDTSVSNLTGTNGTTLSNNDMIGDMLLGGNPAHTDYNLNENGSNFWSPDIFGFNGGFPILANVPLEINKPSEPPVPPQSAVYASSGEETLQAYNFLQPIFVKSDSEIILTAKQMRSESEPQPLKNKSQEQPSYQWYKYNETTNKFTKISNGGKSSSLTRESSDSGIYRVEITIGEFRYTSLSRTVLENPSGKVVVTFDSNGGTPAAPHQVFVNENDTVSKPAVNPTKTDYVFAGWYEKKDGNLKENSWVFETTPVTKNITLYAKWTVTVRFDGENVTIPDITFPQTVTADTKQSYTLIKADGYRLPDEIEVEMGDKELTAGTEYIYNNETGQLTLNNVSGNVTITANGVKVFDVMINIKLNSDLYTNYSGKVFLVGDKKYEINPDDGTCTKTIDSGTYTVKVGEDEGSAEIYLDKWDSSSTLLDILFWTVTFDYNYYGSTDDTKAVLDGSTLSPPDNPTRSNYKFEGWYTEEECTNEWDLNTPPVIEEDITLYAKWRYIPPEPIYSLCLHSNDSDNLTKRYSGTYATKITLPSVESINWNNNNNCTFIEWNSKADGSGESFKAGDKFSLGSEIWNLYAVWSDSSVHNVTFNSNGGSNVSSQKVTDGYRASESETPAKEGHTFKYWSLNGEKYDFNKSVREDITLKAEYEVNQYKVSFYYKGELLTTKTADFNTSLEDRMPSLPSGTNEWNSDENGKGDKFTSETAITKDIEVYAVSSSHSFNSVLIIGGITAVALLALLAAWLYYTRSKNQ